MSRYISILNVSSVPDINWIVNDFAGKLEILPIYGISYFGPFLLSRVFCCLVTQTFPWTVEIIWYGPTRKYHNSSFIPCLINNWKRSGLLHATVCHDLQRFRFQRQKHGPLSWPDHHRSYSFRLVFLLFQLDKYFSHCSVFVSPSSNYPFLHITLLSDTSIPQ